ncbi:hypothetical protein DAI22_06g128733 [Oryza sativa Japonica Group]|nr:hypothetical protein DAI22_06g128733 [Oryza sativa Japonica Group]
MSRASSIPFRLHLQANQFITRRLDGRNKSKPVSCSSDLHLMELWKGFIILHDLAGM